MIFGFFASHAQSQLIHTQSHLYFLWNKQERNQFQIQSIILLEKGLSRLIPLIEGIEDNQFEPIPDPHTCQYCDFAGICPDRV